jgi:NADH-quinone oxidoreductase subunit L
MVVDASWLRWIVAFPALGVLLNVTLGRRVPGSVKAIGPGVLLASFVVTIAMAVRLFGLAEGSALADDVYTWIRVGAFQADVAFRMDALSAVMCLVVTGIGFLIHVYSVGYMHDDPSFGRFFTYLNLFVTAMLILVLADNLLLLFVGWEGVGLCSYLLIGFWYDKVENAVAGKKAFLVNRIGDAGFLLGLFLLIQHAGTLQVSALAEKTAALEPWALAICLLLFVGACGKSAQIPLYVWLPDAMAGPTPVSALIHAATMVTAGVYLVARLHFLYALAPAALAVVACIGAATALLAAIIGTAQNDIKKVLAYSTVSQLGFMFLGLGTGVAGAAIFHVVTHAFFKGLLFLGAGSVIHAMSGEQDMRKMGGLRTRTPITFWTMVAGTAAIAGVPFTSGFFSKDEIIAGAFLGPHAQPVLGAVAYVAAFLTAFYMGRMLFMTFFGECRASHEVEHHIHESPPVMTLPLVVLAVFSLAGGFIPVPEVIAPAIGHPHEVHAAAWMMGLAIAVGLGGLALAYWFYVVQPAMPHLVVAQMKGLYKLARDAFRVDQLYDRLIVRPLFALADVLAERFDPGVIDGVVNGAATFVAGMSGLGRRLQTGNVQHYALSFLAGAALLVAWFVRR